MATQLTAVQPTIFTAVERTFITTILSTQQFTI
jgi:hypothetical protein